MHNQFQARWLSAARSAELKRRGNLRGAMLLDHFKGPLLIEPVGSNLGDGAILGSWEADFELQPAWILGPSSTLQRARQLLGLQTQERATAGV